MAGFKRVPSFRRDDHRRRTMYIRRIAAQELSGLGATSPYVMRPVRRPLNGIGAMPGFLTRPVPLNVWKLGLAVLASGVLGAQAYKTFFSGR